MPFLNEELGQSFTEGILRELLRRVVLTGSGRGEGGGPWLQASRGIGGPEFLEDVWRICHGD